MKSFLLVAQIITAALLTGAILVQTRGTGFARSWRSSASFTRRGLEKLLFRLTFVIAIIFILVSALQATF